MYLCNIAYMALLRQMFSSTSTTHILMHCKHEVSGVSWAYLCNVGCVDAKTNILH